MKTADKRIFSQAGPWGIVLRATVILVFGLGFFYNMTPALADDPKCGNSKLDPGEECDGGTSCSDCACPAWFTPDGDESAPGCSDPCEGVAFSTETNEDTAMFGCSVAAALHYGGTSLDSVRAHVARYSRGSRGQKWLARYNKGLMRLAKDTFWPTFSYIFSRSEIMGWDDAALVAALIENATRLDVMHQNRRTDLKVRGLVKSATDQKADGVSGVKACSDPAPDPAQTGGTTPNTSVPDPAAQPVPPAAPPSDPPAGSQTP